MRFVDTEKLEAIDPRDFENTRPYPFLNSEGLLTREGFETLLANMPDPEIFERNEGKKRRAGQAPHDRLSLEYDGDTQIPAPWEAFIEELCDGPYRAKMAQLMGAKRVLFRFHWHYTRSGRWVSPHTDSPREHGSHLFYFNDEASWDPAWGGETLVLDDGGRLDYNSAPSLSEFDGEIACRCIGNVSSIMKRTDHAWHAVRPIECPEGIYRRVLIVVMNPDSLFWKARDRLIGKRKAEF